MDSSILRRHFVAIATANYDDDSLPPLDVQSEVQQLTEWLVDEGLDDRSFRISFPDLATDPDEESLRTAFRTPAKPWNSRDAAVVFVTGHGEVADDVHWLILKKSNGLDLPNSALRTSDFIRWLRRTDGIEHLLLIIDACFAGSVARDTVRFDDELPQTWLILPSAEKDQPAAVGGLTSAIATAVAKLRSVEGAKFGTNRKYFRVSDFVDTVSDNLYGQTLNPIYRGKLNAEHICLPNPHYLSPDSILIDDARQELALPKADLEGYWSPRARGIDIPDRWLFTGRTKLLQALVETISSNGDPKAAPIILVTGAAGSGKSAALARVVTLSDSRFREFYSTHVAKIPQHLLPQVGAVDVALLATGKYPHEILGKITATLRVSVSVGSDLKTQIAACRSQIGTRWANRKPTTLVLDALDESADPAGVVQVLRYLAEEPGFRALIGVRSTAVINQPSNTDVDRTLVGRISSALAAKQIWVDSDEWWNQQDLETFTVQILKTTDESPYRYDSMSAQARDVARLVTEHAGRSFLLARMAAAYLTELQVPIDQTDIDIRRVLDDGVVGIFSADLYRVYPDPEQRSEAIDLLRAAAFANGRGIPWGDVWPAMANAISGFNSKYGDRDIASLLTSSLSAYLVRDIEDDTTVYRLFHDSLREGLVGHIRELNSSDRSYLKLGDSPND